MTQLVLDVEGITLELPESRRGGYCVTRTPLSEELIMASGRMVRELRGNVYEISYQYGYLEESEKNRFLQVCEKGWRQPILCRFLLPSGDMGESRFFVTEFTWPKFMWSRGENGIPRGMWGDFRFHLREVDPH